MFAYSKVLKNNDIALISLRASFVYTRKGSSRTFLVSIEDINYTLLTKLAAVLSTSLSSKFQDFADMFSPNEAKKLPLPR